MQGNPHSLSKGMQISEVAKENKMGVPKTRNRTVIGSNHLATRYLSRILKTLCPNKSATLCLPQQNSKEQISEFNINVHQQVIMYNGILFNCCYLWKNY